MSVAVRWATTADIPVLQQLIADSARRLGRADYSEEQIEAALRGAMGVDTVLIRDRTYFVAEAGPEIVGFGVVELMATLPGRRLYEVQGYVAGAPVQYPLADGLTMELVPMRKPLT